MKPAPLATGLRTDGTTARLGGVPAGARSRRRLVWPAAENPRGARAAKVARLCMFSPVSTCCGARAGSKGQSSSWLTEEDITFYTRGGETEGEKVAGVQQSSEDRDTVTARRPVLSVLQGPLSLGRGFCRV